MPKFIFSTGNQVNVAAARTTHIDIWNGNTARTVRVDGIYVIPTQAAVVGGGLVWEVIRTTDIGTGGSGLTLGADDPRNDTADISPVTARSKPTGGATGSTVLLTLNTTSEETLPYPSEASTVNHIPAGMSIFIPPETGLKIDQTTNSSVGSTNIECVISMV